MKKSLVTSLRDRTTTLKEFREASDKLATLLALEFGETLPTCEIPIETPLSPTKGFKLTHNIILVPILRSGLALLPTFLRYFPHSKVGFIGLRRDEKTAIPSQYYINLPQISSDHKIVILEPMIATSGSILEAIKSLIHAGALEENITIASVLACQEGIAVLNKGAPKVKLIAADYDPYLNAQKFIVPGLGDFGDRYFGND